VTSFRSDELLIRVDGKQMSVNNSSENVSKQLGKVGNDEEALDDADRPVWTRFSTTKGAFTQRNFFFTNI
jgi:hypothetical protein